MLINQNPFLYTKKVICHPFNNNIQRLNESTKKNFNNFLSLITIHHEKCEKKIIKTDCDKDDEDDELNVCLYNFYLQRL